MDPLNGLIGCQQAASLKTRPSFFLKPGEGGGPTGTPEIGVNFISSKDVKRTPIFFPGLQLDPKRPGGGGDLKNKPAEDPLWGGGARA